MKELAGVECPGGEALGGLADHRTAHPDGRLHRPRRCQTPHTQQRRQTPHQGDTQQYGGGVGIDRRLRREPPQRQHGSQQTAAGQTHQHEVQRGERSSPFAQKPHPRVDHGGADPERQRTDDQDRCQQTRPIVQGLNAQQAQGGQSQEGRQGDDLA